ncbi:MAG: DNA primase [Chitinivibrionia bacterium]|nr:DNA primase [Chitinivibrionia bacterium]
MFIPDKTIDEIRQRADIVDVVSKYVELRRAGSNFKALCPFHEEKTPSFMVSPDKQIFHCFGCGKGGNVFVFLMEMEGISFPEAAKSLGESYGVEVSFKETAGDAPSKNDAYYRANEFAARWYHRALMDSKAGEKTRRYLAARGISTESCAHFLLGCAAETWDGLFKAARKEGIPLETLKELKLVVPAEQRGGYFDYFRKRLIFPISSVSGRVLAFGARTLAKDLEPKSLNSAESPVFAKRRTFYGINHARDRIRSERRVLLVEGYTDCISLHQAGYTNTVASCGTALTPDHASALRRLTMNALLLPDSDSAGEKAAVSAGALLLATGLSVKVARFPAGMDPDNAARELGNEGLSTIIGEAMDYFEYLNYIIKYRSNTLSEREDSVRRVVDGLGQAGDRLHLEMLLQEASRVLAVDIESLRAQAERTRRYGQGARESKKRDIRGSVSHTSPSRDFLEKMTLRLLMEDSPYSGEARSKIDADDFNQESCRELYKLLDSALDGNIDLTSRTFQQLTEQAGVAGVAAEIALITIPPGDRARLLHDHVKRIKEFKIRDELNVLSEKLRTLPEESDEAIAIIEYYNRLKIALSEL